MDLTAMTDEVATALKEIDGLQVQTDWDERFNAPGVIVLPDDNWLSAEGQAFGSVGVNLKLLVLAGSVERETSLLKVHELVESILPIVYDLGWRFSPVGAPETVVLNGATILGCQIQITKSASVFE
jgi:hypothetical protein